jgi:predicted phage terminase large subunit-like protein
MINSGVDIDEELKELVDEKNIATQRQIGEKKHEKLTTQQVDAIRRRAKTDLFFLGFGLLGYDRFTVHLHGHLCSWLKAHDNYQFRLILLPRGHFKSTLVTVSETVQTILPDVAGNAIYPANLGPNCRVLIAHETSESAQDFLFQVTGHFLSNPTLMAFFPECIPSTRKQRINKSELELPRDRVWGEPTVDTIGVGGRKQGSHYNKLKLDDLIGDKTRDSPSEMASAISWINNIQSFFSRFSKDKFDLIGTRWAKQDLYQHVINQYGDQIAKYVRPVWEIDPLTGTKVPIFPEEFSIKGLEILQKDRKVFTAQYLNNPEEGSGEFDPAWLKYYRFAEPRVVAFGDESDETRVRVSDMDLIFLVDPAIHSDSGFLVTGVDKRNRIFILEAVKKTWTPKDFVDFVFKKVQQWWPRLVAIEDVIFSNLYKPYFEAEMRLRGVRFPIRMMPTKQKAKEYRIRSLLTYFQAGQIYFNAGQQDLVDEYTSFGASSDIHMLDAMAYGPILWRGGKTKEDREHEKKAEDEILRAIDPETGYSKLYDEPEPVET